MTMAIKLNYQYTPIRYRVLTELLRGVREWWRWCILDWAEATQQIIHVDTGMAASSLTPLLEDVGGVGTGFLIYGTPTISSARNISGKSLGTPRTPELGAQMGEGAYHIGFGTAANMIMTFEYKIKIYQWALYEATWRAGDIGHQALVNTAQNKIDTVARALLPKVKS